MFDILELSWFLTVTEDILAICKAAVPTNATEKTSKPALQYLQLQFY